MQSLGQVLLSLKKRQTDIVDDDVVIAPDYVSDNSKS